MFEQIRKIIIKNIDDDKMARDVILKIKDNDSLHEMRKIIIKNITDLDLLKPLLLDIQLIELLVNEEEEEIIDADQKKLLRN